MIDPTLYYPQKLGRFLPYSCMTVYYSEPIAKGRFNDITLETYGALGYLHFTLLITDDFGWMVAGSIFSSGIISGEVVSWTSGVSIEIKVNKDSFVTTLAVTDFINKHNGIYYDYEVLKHYNEDSGLLKNAVLSNVMINNKFRINNYQTYSQFDFTYNKDFYYEIETKNVVLRDMNQVDDLFRQGSFVLQSNDDSVLRLAALDNLPNVEGISGDTVDIIEQPYFGGVQNNEWYRATLIDMKPDWSNGRFKGKFRFKITG